MENSKKLNYDQVINKLIDYREKNNYSISFVAKSISISTSTYRAIERNESVLNLQQVIKVCNFYKLEISSFLFDEFITKKKCEQKQDVESLVHQMVTEIMEKKEEKKKSFLAKIF